jgi:hypothetical protein
MLNWLVKRAEGLLWVPVVIGWGVGCLLVAEGSKMASSGLGLEEQEVCPLVLMSLVLTGQEEYFSTHTLAHDNDSDWL